MKTINLPFNYSPRAYQLPSWKAIERGIKRFADVWHRRAGKDKTWLNITFTKMFERKGAYHYYFPTYKQGKKIIWDGMDKDGFKFMDHLPERLRKNTDKTNMFIETKFGSTFQIIGTDKMDNIVGPNPVGCVFSEYALQRPRAWNFIRPILAENDGWAAFNFTPRGNNHAKLIYDLAKGSELWHSSLLTVDDTGAISKKVLENERKEIIHDTGSEALYLQEYFCSFDAPLAGAYYVTQLLQARKENRITRVPYNENFPVDTYWDLGYDDSMTIWFAQSIANEIRFIDYYDNFGKGLNHYFKHLQELPYVYGEHFAPHDIEVHELTGEGKSRKEYAEGMGIDFQVAPRMPIEEGIAAVRRIFHRCYFDETKCATGLDCLKNYQKEWDEKRKIFRDHPLHDWASHGADAFKTFALSYRGQPARRRVPSHSGEQPIGKRSY
jgi:hypothetical protein